MKNKTTSKMCKKYDVKLQMKMKMGQKRFYKIVKPNTHKIISDWPALLTS